MTGRVQSIQGNRVTIDGTTYEFGEGVRWLLERCSHVEAVIVGGRVTQVGIVPQDSHTTPRAGSSASIPEDVAKSLTGD